MTCFLKYQYLVMLFFASIMFGIVFFNMSQENIELDNIEYLHFVVKKSERKLEVFDGENLIKTYTIVLGFTPVGDKEKENDGKTPEGDFYVFTKNDQSKFYLSLGVSYPNIEDAERGLRENLITQEDHTAIVNAINEGKMPPQNTKLGGVIYIHGGGIAKDWTWGCMAMRDEEMKEIFDVANVGTPITIKP